MVAEFRARAEFDWFFALQAAAGLQSHTYAHGMAP
jgi:hypothetical protein